VRSSRVPARNPARARESALCRMPEIAKPSGPVDSGLLPGGSGAGPGGRAEDGGYPIDRVELSGGDAHHQVVGFT
jgi:hypothetical protein